MAAAKDVLVQANVKWDEFLYTKVESKLNNIYINRIH